MVAGGFTVAPGDGTAHFGLVVNLNNPPACQYSKGGQSASPRGARRPGPPRTDQARPVARPARRPGPVRPTGIRRGAGGRRRRRTDRRWLRPGDRTGTRRGRPTPAVRRYRRPAGRGRSPIVEAAPARRPGRMSGVERRRIVATTETGRPVSRAGCRPHDGPHRRAGRGRAGRGRRRADAEVGAQVQVQVEVEVEVEVRARRRPGCVAPSPGRCSSSWSPRSSRAGCWAGAGTTSGSSRRPGPRRSRRPGRRASTLSRSARPQWTLT